MALARMIETDGVEVEFDPRAQTFLHNPFPIFAALRQYDPVHWSAALQGWVLTRYNDVKTGMDMSADFVRPFAEEYQRRKGANQDIADLGQIIGAWPSFFDAPAHTRLRTLLNQVVNRSVAEAMQHRIKQIADEFLARLVDRDEVDVMTDFAYPLPVTVIGEMLGITAEAERRLLMEWSDDLHLFIGQAVHSKGNKYQKAAEAARQLDVFFRDALAARRVQPRDDGLTKMLAARNDGDRLSDDEIAASCTMLFYAGHETTAGLIGLAVLALCRHQDQLRKLAANPALLSVACEEFFRYDGPVQAMVRVADGDYELGGKRIHRGDRIYPFINAANRDPEIFPDPDVLDIERQDNRHIVFGHGVHYCLGAWLARAEAPAGIGALLEKVTKIELVRDDIAYRDALAFRAPTSLPIRVQWAQ